MAQEYISTPYGTVPAATWHAYRAAVAIQQAAESHRQTRATETDLRSVSLMNSDITPGVF